MSRNDQPGSKLFIWVKRVLSQLLPLAIIEEVARRLRHDAIILRINCSTEKYSRATLHLIAGLKSKQVRSIPTQPQRINSLNRTLMTRKTLGIASKKNFLEPKTLALSACNKFHHVNENRRSPAIQVIFFSPCVESQATYECVENKKINLLRRRYKRRYNTFLPKGALNTWTEKNLVSRTLSKVAQHARTKTLEKLIQAYPFNDENSLFGYRLGIRNTVLENGVK